MRADYKGITVMNAVLCLCVVMIHLTAVPVVHLTYGGFYQIMAFINKALCFSVPAFIFLSGYKLYGKYDNEKIDISGFYIGRIKKIILPYCISVFAYFIYFYSKEMASFSELPENIFFGTRDSHFYYIIIAIQLYLVFPLISYVFKKLPGIITIVSLFITVICVGFARFLYADRFIGTYIFYFVMGMFFSKYKIAEKCEKHVFIGAGIYLLSLIAHVGIKRMTEYKGMAYPGENYINLIYVLLSVVFLLGICIRLAVKSDFIYGISRKISGVSFSVYLYHVLVMRFLRYDVLRSLNLTVKNLFFLLTLLLYLIIFIYAFSSYALKKNKDRRSKND